MVGLKHQQPKQPQIQAEATQLQLPLDHSQNNKHFYILPSQTQGVLKTIIMQ